MDQEECSAIFVIFLTSAFGALFPILTRKSKKCNIPAGMYDFAKYFGSGVIIATAFIHLLVPAHESLSSPCLSEGWHTYPWAEAIAMSSVFAICIIELVAYRAGKARFTKLGMKYNSHGIEAASDDPHKDHGHTMGGGFNFTVPPPAPPSECQVSNSGKTRIEDEEDSDSEQVDVGAQLIGVAVLELGVVLHSAVIGLTLAVDSQFKTLFAVVIFHQTFEGLGLGSRLSQLKMIKKYNWLPVSAGITYSLVTPMGLAVGLAIRNTYNPNSAKALIVSGCLDSFSAGVLMYTGLVELLAHDFVFNERMLLKSSNGKLAFNFGSVLCGAVLMAILGRWS
ncbi:Zinc/iron permease [Phakopsora pachyrhizi]|uniref:Zinc/iron permease n=2 Tax=Phakopsora pachyrhizi TaxID=170000 RepID=A0AAV0BS64_PHAPC|nr:Zinc/iron permease [Phakopsora pachyrhizi]